MTPLVTAAVLLAAVTRASRNAIAHRIADKLAGFALVFGGGVLIGLAIVPFVAFPAGPPGPIRWPRAVVHIAYYALLMTSFRLGDFGQAYPTARGTAPLVVTVAAYTVIDGLGVRAAHSPLGYIAWPMALEGLVIPACMCARARAGTVRLLRPYAALGLIGAALSVTAYALVLWAQTAPNSPRSPSCASPRSTLAHAVITSLVRAPVKPVRTRSPR